MVSIERAEYCVSKAGAAMTAALFAARLAPHGIGVFELRPGIVATPMTAPVASAYDARIAAGLVPARRWGRPEDVAAAILPLVEGRMAFATGAVIPVDGGLSIPRL
jgi:NAD(P)-dependent dehydrogenase (short-subunit alcohol dehydrogenase family)